MKRLLIGGLAAFAIGLTGCSITGGAPAHTKPVVATVAIAPTAPATLASPVSAPTGSAVRDGRFEFHVGRVERLKTVGDPTGNPYMTATAQGEFIVVTMSVTNIGNQAQSYFGQNQMLVDSTGRQYAPDTTADMWMNTANNATGVINPGNYIWAYVAFDVPVGTPLGGMELNLHDSMLSGGASVQIGGTQ